MGYLTSHYKGKYRLLCPYDQNTLMFPRTLDGELEEADVYITCQKNVKIVYNGKAVLKAYIPSLKRGNKCVKAINDINPDIIIKTVTTDEEVVIYFKAKYLELLEDILKMKTSRASLSPFSPKNLPDYIIPEEELKMYKDLISNFTISDGSGIFLLQANRKFLEDHSNRKHTYEMKKDEMRMRGLKSKEYIHSINLWGKYIEFLKKEIHKRNNEKTDK